MTAHADDAVDAEESPADQAAVQGEPEGQVPTVHGDRRGPAQDIREEAAERGEERVAEVDRVLTDPDAVERVLCGEPGAVLDDRFVEPPGAGTVIRDAVAQVVGLQGDGRLDDVGIEPRSVHGGHDAHEAVGGAFEREVLMQFLVEAVVLSSLGGLIGIVAALAGSVWLASVLRVPFVLNIGIVIVAFLFSAAVGVIFGYFPALKAARLDPIEALRYE